MGGEGGVLPAQDREGVDDWRLANKKRQGRRGARKDQFPGPQRDARTQNSGRSPA